MTVIRRVLIADRGVFARRVISTCRAVGVETVATFVDRDCSHVRDATLAVRVAVPSGDPNTGPNLSDLLAAAARCGADAIHPGRGPLATDPHAARAVHDAGLTWIGPTPAVLATISTKLGARKALADSRVPLLPASVVPSAVTSFPVIVKPSSGRDGRGMRVIRSSDSLAEAFASARHEASLAFGDDTVFGERYVEPARHIDVQVIADTSGTVVPLGERERSIQRHRQRILEEAPSPAVDPGLRTQLFASAVEVAKTLGIVGAASVEFLLSPDGEFHFLKVSSRLDVGHTVTECVFGLDLVRLQLLVAEGGTLPFTTPPPIRGHAIAVRLAAEDPAYDWRPCHGTIHRFSVPGVIHSFGPLLIPGLRLDAAVDDGSVLRPGDDPTLGLVTAWAPTRYEAARLLATALTRARVYGVSTNRDLLVRVLRHPQFLLGEVETSFLDNRPEVFAPLMSSLEAVRLSCLAAALAGSAERRAAISALASLPTGWRNLVSEPQVIAYQGPAGVFEVAYQFDREGNLTRWSVTGAGQDGEDGQPPKGQRPSVRLVSAEATRVVLEVNDVRLVFAVHTVPGHPPITYVDSPEGSVNLAEVPRDRPAID